MAKVTDTARTLTLIASSASGDAAAAPGVADRQREAKVNYLQIYLAKATRRTAEAATPTPTCRNSQPTALLHHVRQTAQTDREGEGRGERGRLGPITVAVALVRMCSLRVQVEMKPKLDATGKLLLRLKKM